MRQYCNIIIIIIMETTLRICTQLHITTAKKELMAGMEEQGV